MAKYPTVAAPYNARHVTDVFKGYDHNPRIDEGAFYHMENLSGDCYPLLSNRGPRGHIADLAAPNGIAGKAQLAYVDGTRLFYGGAELTSYLNGAGFFLTDCPKQMVSMGRIW